VEVLTQAIAVFEEFNPYSNEGVLALINSPTAVIEAKDASQVKILFSSKIHNHNMGEAC
jgi:hypothetical protein